MASATQEQAAANAAANGQGPAPAGTPAAAGEPCADCATGTERVMGLIGLAFAAGLALVAIDLLSGGAVSRLAAGLFARAEGAGDGQPVAG